MDSGMWERVQGVFEEALLLGPDDREIFVRSACGSDPSMLAEVSALLDASTEADTFLGDLARRIGLPTSLELESPDEIPTQRFGPYRVIRLLGRGGMGAVYVAERDDEQFHMEVALKALPTALMSPEARARFLAERQILAGLHHPNIAQLLDGGVSDLGVPFFVMELVDGVPIDEYCRSGALDLKERLHLFLQVCEGVRHAHANLVVHRDLKPRNILVTEDSTAKLLDFGIARILESEEALFRTATRAAHPMTVAYASPEQILGAPPNTSCDVYGLGVLLYRLLTDAHPYDLGPDTTYLEASRIICETPPVPPSTQARATGKDTAQASSEGGKPSDFAGKWAHELKGDLDRIVLKALAKDPEQRYASAGDLADDVQRYMDGRPIRARPATLGYRARRFAGRHKGWIASAAVVVTLIGVLMAMGVRYTMATRQHAIDLEEEAQTTQAVSDFLVGLFTAADPAEGGSDTLRARDILDRGIARAGTDLSAFPLVQARVLRSLAEVYWGLGYAREADSLAYLAVQLRRDKQGPGHPETLADALYLADLNRVMGNSLTRERSQRLYEEIIGLSEGKAESAATRAFAKGGLARLLIDQDEPEEALPYMRDGISLARATVGPDDSRFLNLLQTQAALYRQLEMMDSAAALYQELLTIYESRSPADDMYIGVTLNNLGYLMRVQDRPDEAEAYYRRALEDYGHVRENGQTMVLYNNLLGVLMSQGKVEEIRETGLEGVEFAEARWPANHWRVGMAYSALGQALVGVDRAEEALPHLQQALAVYQASLGDTHTWTSRMRGQCGYALMLMGRYEQAEDELERAYRDLLDSGEEVPPEIKRVSEYLAELYRRTDRPELAATMESG